MKWQTLATMLLLLASMMMPGAPLLAQARSNVQGTIESVMLDDQFMIVDGERLVIREADLVVTYKGEPLRPSLLSSGMSIFYSTHDDGSVRSITLIGPPDILEQLDQH